MKKLLFLAVAFVGGCGAPYTVLVDSISSSVQPENRTCVIIPSDVNTSPQDLQFQEFSTYVKRALDCKGYVVVSDNQEVSIVISLLYGMNSFEHPYSYSTPEYGQTGYSSSTTQGTINTYGKNMTTYSANTTYQPTYGVTGYTTHAGIHVGYTQFIGIVARDVKSGRQLWKITAVHVGNSSDLRFIFPIMIAAIMDYVGENSDHQIHVNLYGTDKRVLQIKGISTK